MTLAMTGPFIAAKGYTRGRSFAERPAVNILVIHTAEGATDEVALGNYFHGSTRGSSNAGIGQDGGYAGYVNYSDTPWAAPPLNQEGEHLELCGFAKWTRAQWLAQPRLLESLARWIAWRCTVRRIPIVLLEPADIKAGKPGVTDHRRVNAVYKKSDHWDVGYGLPWDVVIPRARQLAAVKPAPTPTGTFYVVVAGDTLTSIAKKFKTTVTALATANGLKSPYVLKPGQRLKVPGPAKQTGVVGPFPYGANHYFSTPAVSIRNHSGVLAVDKPFVRMIQEEVGATVDGLYGPGTRAKVISYQTKHGLAPDGVVGPVTWRRMAAS